MCSGKLREDLQGLQVKPGGLLDVSLLSLDVGQIVQRIGMGRVQPEVSENEKKIKNESQVKLIMEHVKQKRVFKIVPEIKRFSNN